MRWKNIVLFIGFCLVALCMQSQKAQAQGEVQTILLSGIVVDGDSSYGVPGVYVYIPKAGVGTITNSVGYFALFTMPGDTIQFRMVGYETKQFIIPQRQDQGMTVIINLQEKVTVLNPVEIYPYPTEAEFKEAFLALELPKPYAEQMEEHFNQQMMRQMSVALPMDGSANYRYYMNQRINAQSNRFFMPSIPLLNPFAWAQFIKSVRNGDLKDKSWKENNR